MMICMSDLRPGFSAFGSAVLAFGVFQRLGWAVRPLISRNDSFCFVLADGPVQEIFLDLSSPRLWWRTAVAMGSLILPVYKG
jgi:hypothetical protein